MSSAAPASSQAPVSTPAATTAQPSAAATTSSPNQAPSSQAATTTPQTTAAPSSSSTPATDSSSHASSSSAVTSSASDTSSSSTPTKASSSSSASRASLTSSITFVLQTSDGQVFTQTSVITVPASGPTESQSSRSSSTSFFHNTGAVAGVFSVVGIIALVVIFILLTSFVRRRRARKFDQEIDEAAAVAAAAQMPDFDDFDYTSGTGISYGGQYSETSHGTYNQQPLSHERSRQNLNDIPTPYDTHNNMGAASGAAGIGARGRSMRASGMQDPFGALANPPEQYEMTESRRSWNQGSLRVGGGPEVTTYDMLQAAGMSGSDPYAVTRAPSSRLPNLPKQPGVSGLTRSQSQGASTLPTTTEDYPMPTAAPAYPGGQDRPYPPEKARYSGLYTQAGDADVHGGYQDQPSASLDNPHSPAVPSTRSQDEHEDEQYEPNPFVHGREEAARASLADDEDYGFNIGNRVLRVANE